MNGWCNMDLLNEVTEALTKSLDFMKQEVQNINLDGAFGCRIADDQLSYLVDSLSRSSNISFAQLSKKIEHVQNLAAETTDEAIGYIRKNDEQYYRSLGAVLKRGQWKLRYASRPVHSSLRTEPIKYENGQVESTSDQCMAELLGTNVGGNERCNISEKCWEIMTAPGNKGYSLTHQVLYLELGEINGCLLKMNYKSARGVNYLQDYFCANVLRDAEAIAEHHFPDGDQDLLMEQVGLCGMLGYKDMFQNTWLAQIIEWQQPNGCYTTKLDPHRSHGEQTTALHKIRHKRSEKILKGNCLSHKTSVALMALTMNLRFCLEEMDFHAEK